MLLTYPPSKHLDTCIVIKKLSKDPFTVPILGYLQIGLNRLKIYI